MQSADYWRLCDKLSIFQAIMLILVYDPENQSSYDIENSRNHTIPQGYGALKTALINAVSSQTVEGRLVHQNHDHRNNDIETPMVNIDESIISVDSLKGFLSKKGFREGFFFPEGNIFEAYLDKQNPFFASKLAAAIQAWKTVTNDKELQKGKTPKQALEKWLRENASKYGLTKEDGTLNETGIEEICKIANWKPEGGAAKTPAHGKVQENPPPPSTSHRKLRVFGAAPEPEDDLLDDIPF